ncbi:MAG: amidohydrolase family protein [Planctomycetota bacterium]|jgi:imidazolonepropionase-like amidohydrolase
MLTSLILSAALAASGSSAPADGTSWTIHADKVYTSTGKVHESALIVVEGGKIRAITPGVEATRDALKAQVVTAGMVDASARLNTGSTSVEQSSEVTPLVTADFGVDLFSPRWGTLARTGVTSAFITPLNQNCIGGLGAVMKTAGERTLEARTVAGAPMLCGAIGSQPSQRNSSAFGRPTSFFNRRPTTRMGVEWEWRKSFFEAAQAKEPDPSQKMLLDALAGKVGVFVQAWATQDIRTAVFLKEEMAREGFGEMRLVIDAGAEAWREPAMLVRTNTAVVLPPVPAQGRTTDGALMSIECARVLRDNGIAFALSGHGSARLDIQAGLAMRGGLTREQALRAVTLTPAQLLGVDERVGSVEAGKDADLLLWNGEPFEATSRPVGVLVGGHLALDPR